MEDDGTRRAGRRRTVAVAAVTLASTLCLCPSAFAAQPPAESLAFRASAAVGSGAAEGTPARPGLAAMASATPPRTKPSRVCPDGPCEAIVDPQPHRAGSRRLALPNAKHVLEGSGELGGMDPSDLQSAYDIPTFGGADETIAVVDAYAFPEAEHALAVYRERYGLPPCTRVDGCFRMVNQRGQESDYPPAQGWAVEQALDIEMVSAACPQCHILLVESEEPTLVSLGEAENEAVALGAEEISNSWAGQEGECVPLDACEADAAAYYEHPGVTMFFAAGDEGWDYSLDGGDSPAFPASLPSVVAVGGTTLRRSSDARGWQEETWYEPEHGLGGGSGCSRFAKPAWQTDAGCRGRMTDDVAADGACESPMSVYIFGWGLVCGTSAATPLVAGIEAHAEPAIRSLPGAEAFYRASAGLEDVTTGVNGKCPQAPEVAYFCSAGAGYDGPTGVGSPYGPLQDSGAAPQAETFAPRAVAGGEATLTGFVLPRGLPSTYEFEYGTGTSYGATAPAPEGTTGTSGEAVSATVEGLSPGTVYHYRLVAHNSAGSSYGPDVEFSTSAPVVSSLAPDALPAAGGAQVTIHGSGLLAAQTVSFGSRKALAFTVQSDESITAQAPPGEEGVAQVTVTTPAGASSGGPGSHVLYEAPGPVLAWGRNEGRLGNGETFINGSSATPVEVPGLPEAQSLAVGWEQSLAVVDGGLAMGWGRGGYGGVGDGTYATQGTPTPVCAEEVSECGDGPYLEGVTAVSAGRLASLALLGDGTVAAWGGNYYGALGADTERAPYPLPVCTAIESPCQPDHRLSEVAEIAAGGDFVLARLRDGTVTAWGANRYGELGDGTRTGPETCGEAGEACSRIPVPVSGLREVAAIAAGQDQALALLRDGTVMAWGRGDQGELGNGKTTEAVTVPTPVCAVGTTKPACSPLTGVKAVSSGVDASWALLDDGDVVSWGQNLTGALGNDSFSAAHSCKLFDKIEKLIKSEKGPAPRLPCSLVPTTVQGLSGVVRLAQGEHSAGALVELEDGRLEAWGEGEDGELGDGALESADSPVAVCPAFAAGSCEGGPTLAGRPTALAAGETDIVGMSSSQQPTVTSVDPAHGPARGGTRVAIQGTHLRGASAVDFGGRPATAVEVDGEDELSAVTPPGSGTAQVTVTTPVGVSAVGAAGFVYEGPPTVATGAPAEVGRESAELQASVDPDGEAITACRFEYGTTTAYGSSVPCSSLPPAGLEPVPVSAAAAGLAPGTSYYYRAVAANAAGEAAGEAQSFTTASLPELGRCVKSSSRQGAYKDGSCVKAAAGRAGGHEWAPWPAPGAAFTVTGGAFALKEEGGHVDFECASSSGSGEYTGALTATLTLTLAGCRANDFEGAACNTAGAPAGEAVLNLHAELGLVEATRPNAPAGWELAPPEGAPMMALQCGAEQRTVSGTVIGYVPADKPESSFPLSFEAGGDEQEPARFLGGPQQGLTFQTWKVGLFTTLALAGGEALEVKALP